MFSPLFDFSDVSIHLLRMMCFLLKVIIQAMLPKRQFELAGMFVCMQFAICKDSFLSLLDSDLHQEPIWLRGKKAITLPTPCINDTTLQNNEHLQMWRVFILLANITHNTSLQSIKNNMSLTDCCLFMLPFLLGQ